MASSLRRGSQVVRVGVAGVGQAHRREGVVYGVVQSGAPDAEVSRAKGDLRPDPPGEDLPIRILEGQPDRPG
jgi:hypothetical protein